MLADFDLEILEQLLDPRRAVASRQSHELQGIVDVVERAQPREEGVEVVLEYVGTPRLLNGLAVEQHLPGIQRQQPGDQVDQGALAAAVRPENRDELTLRQVEVEAVVDDGPVERFAQAANGDEGLAGRRPPLAPPRRRDIRGRDDAQLRGGERPWVWPRL